MNYPNELYQDTDQFIAHRFKDREEWLSYRIKGIGGSDSSAAIGMNPWKTNQDLYRQKVGPEESRIFNNKAMEYGTEAEEPLRWLFQLDHPEMEVHYLDHVILQSKTTPYLLYSPDGLLLEKETGRKGILEIKTTEILQSMQKEKWKDQVPMNYYIQVLHGLLVSGFDFVILKAQLKRVYRNENGSEELRIECREYRFERSEKGDDLDYLKDGLEKFWKCIEEKKEPGLLLTL